MHPFSGKTHLMEGKSVVKLMELAATKAVFDFIYIDGSHAACDVLTDSVLAWQILKPGGICIFDDYEWKYKGQTTEPKLGIDCFLAGFHGKYNLLYKAYQVAIEKR
jgi:predicted O-methyltransferase YrrM